MISRMLKAGAAVAAAAVGLYGLQAQACEAPHCGGAYAPASPAYVFQPGPTPAYAGEDQGGYGYCAQGPAMGPPAPYGYGEPGYGGQGYGGQGYAGQGYGGGYAGGGYDRYGGEYGGHRGQDYGRVQPYRPGEFPPGPYTPAFGRGVVTQRPYAGHGYGYLVQGYDFGANCGTCQAPPPPPPPISPCANPCGYGQSYGHGGYQVQRYEEQSYEAAPVSYESSYETSAPAVNVESDFFFGGLAGGSGPGLEIGGPSGGGGSTFTDNFGFAATNAFSNSMSNAYANAHANASAYASASAYARAVAVGGGHMYGWGGHGCYTCHKPMPKPCNCHHH